MKTTRRSLKERYIIFIVSIVVIIIATQAVVQYDLDQQNEDAKLINLAGRQRMLSQRISKLVLYIENDIEVMGKINPDLHQLDTLQKIVNEWEGAHQWLLDHSKSGKNRATIDSLLQVNKTYMKPIVEACRAVMTTPDISTTTAAIEKVANAEIHF